MLYPGVIIMPTFDFFQHLGAEDARNWSIIILIALHNCGMFFGKSLSLFINPKRVYMIYFFVIFRQFFVVGSYLIANFPENEFWGHDAVIVINTFLVGSIWGNATILIVKNIDNVEPRLHAAAGSVSEYLEMLGILLGSILSVTVAIELVKLN